MYKTTFPLIEIHDFNREAKFTITEKYKNNTLDSITRKIKTQKDKPVNHRQTLTPKGFNIELNHPQSTTL